LVIWHIAEQKLYNLRREPCIIKR